MISPPRSTRTLSPDFGADQGTSQRPLHGHPVPVVVDLAIGHEMEHGIGPGYKAAHFDPRSNGDLFDRLLTRTTSRTIRCCATERSETHGTIRQISMPYQRPASSAQQVPIAARATFGSQPGTASDVTRFFVAPPAAHLLLESASLDQFTEATNRLLDRFILP